MGSRMLLFLAFFFLKGRKVAIESVKETNLGLSPMLLKGAFDDTSPEKLQSSHKSSDMVLQRHLNVRSCQVMRKPRDIWPRGVYLALGKKDLGTDTLYSEANKNILK